jgi:hypothetical protein
MPYIRYGGVNYKQVRHAVHCKLCSDTLQSNHRHDFKMCSCGSIGIDGGLEPGNRILGDPENIEPRSMYSYSYARDRVIWLPQDIVETIVLQKLSLLQQLRDQHR